MILRIKRGNFFVKKVNKSVTLAYFGASLYKTTAIMV